VERLSPYNIPKVSQLFVMEDGGGGHSISFVDEPLSNAAVEYIEVYTYDPHLYISKKKVCLVKLNQLVILRKSTLIFMLLAPVAAFADGFSGAYVGGQLGYVDADDDGDETSSDWSQESSPDGPSFGLLAGYNWVSDSGFLLGVEFDVEERTSTDDESYQQFAGVTNTRYTVESELKAAISLRGRIGYFLNPRTLVYTTAGVASVRVRREFKDLDLEEGGGSSSETQWQDGWTAGVGLEYMMKDEFSVRAEYRYTDLGEHRIDATVYDETYSQDLSEDSFRVALIYRF